MRRIREFRDHGFERGQLRPQNLPSGCEGGDGEGGGEKIGQKLGYFLEGLNRRGLLLRWRWRWRGVRGGGMHLLPLFPHLFFLQRCGIFIIFYFFLGRFDGLLRETVGNGEKKKHVSK